MVIRFFIYCWNVLLIVFWILMVFCDFFFCFLLNNVSILESFLKKKKFILKSIFLYFSLDIEFGFYSLYIVLVL